MNYRFKTMSWELFFHSGNKPTYFCIPDDDRIFKLLDRKIHSFLKIGGPFHVLGVVKVMVSIVSDMC